MNPWFRMYESVLDDPKVQKLSAEDFRTWVNILCIACRNDGLLPGATDIAFSLRMTDAKCVRSLIALVNAGLLDKSETGLAPHNWNKRQYKSDVSTERVKRFRKRHETINGTAPDSDSDSDTEQRKNKKRAVAREVLRPIGVDDQIWSDFKAHRKTLRAPITETAIAGIEREAALASIPLNDALRICCERGWRGFKAEWVKEKLTDPKGRVSDAALQTMSNLREYLG